MPGLIHKNCQLILGRVRLKAPLGVWGKEYNKEKQAEPLINKQYFAYSH
jgi:hypothetical protein